jgi:hypothetical protein
MNVSSCSVHPAKITHNRSVKAEEYNVGALLYTAAYQQSDGSVSLVLSVRCVMITPRSCRLARTAVKGPDYDLLHAEQNERFKHPKIGLGRLKSTSIMCRRARMSK